MAKAITWPLVALFGIMAAALFGIYFVAGPEDRSALLAALIPISNGVTMVLMSKKIHNVQQTVDAVEHNTNGRLQATVTDAVNRAIDKRL